MIKTVDELAGLFREHGVEGILPFVNDNLAEVIKESKEKVVKLADEFPIINSKPKQVIGEEDPGDKIYHQTVALAKEIDHINEMIKALEETES